MSETESNSLVAAYAELCDEAEAADGAFVSLYSAVRAYGGPEEGGWWYDVVQHHASQWCGSRREAEQLRERCETHAAELTADARARHGEYCLRGMDFCEERGLDADYLPEVDSAEEFYVAIEDRAGSLDNTREARPQYC